MEEEEEEENFIPNRKRTEEDLALPRRGEVGSFQVVCHHVEHEGWPRLLFVY